MTKTELEEDLRATFERAAASVPYVPDLVSRATGGARQRQRRTWAGSAAAAACVAIVATAGVLWQDGGPATEPAPATGRTAPASPTAVPPSASVAKSLIGTWRPVRVEGSTDLRHSRPDEPVLTFKDNGTWSGSDGCNSLGGTYTVAEEGGFSSTSQGQRLAACANVPHGGLLAETVRVTVDGSTLRLLAADGRQVASYVRTR